MTSNYGFTLPPIGAGSWYASFFSALVNSIETAVRTTELTVAAHASVILSSYVSNTVRLGYDSGGQLAGSSVWTQLSAAPFGAFVGSFRILAPQRHAYLRFTQDFWGPDYVNTPTSFTQGAYAWRCIVLPGSINVAGSAWMAKWGDASGPNDDGQRHVCFSAITSLGPGQYQARIEHKHWTFNAADSGWYQHPGHSTILEAWEVERG